MARDSYGQLLATLAIRSRDLVACEDALADAFAAALDVWPERGVPRNPVGWLFTAARNRLLDVSRRRGVRARAADALLMRLTEPPSSDERLPLLFACTHPAIDVRARTPLMLQVVLGLDAATIARAFWASESAMAKRLVRAKQKIKRAGVPFEVPEPAVWHERLSAVLDAIYAAFGLQLDFVASEPSGPKGLTAEALHLGEVVARLLPEEAEARGLIALMLYVESRRAARSDAKGELIGLDEQDPERWDARLVQGAEGHLHAAARHASLGRYQLEAAIQSCHVARLLQGADNWGEIVRLYGALVQQTGAVGAYLGLAAAEAAWQGAEVGLRRLDALDDPRLDEHQPYWALRTALLAEVGQHEASAPALQRALELTEDPRVARWLRRRGPG
ncbi:MAG: hypothetical protein KTR31_20595 [Myxococcales bacterium]|nr:hypothetical protein [Myxococcales bacterium]